MLGPFKKNLHISEKLIIFATLFIFKGIQLKFKITVQCTGLSCNFQKTLGSNKFLRSMAKQKILDQIIKLFKEEMPLKTECK